MALRELCCPSESFGGTWGALMVPGNLSWSLGISADPRRSFPGIWGALLSSRRLYRKAFQVIRHIFFSFLFP